MQDYEKLGAFYLGRAIDPASGAVRAEPLLYDSKDLTTHAVCVGMTGSGKTGLCLSLIEEAAIDGVPVLAIDPKGDLGDLLLTFPELRPVDFAPWIDPGEAVRKGRTPEQHAEAVAAQWRSGLEESGQDGARVRRLQRSAEFAIYTPGSDAGIQVSVLRSFAAPSAALLADGDAYAERLTSAVSGLLSMLGVDADPVRSREHVFVSNVVDRAWRAGEDLELGDLIRRIQAPAFARIGVLDVDTFLPPAERTKLAMGLNAMLASPGFAAWLDGEPLDVQRMLWTDDGRPRVSIVSIAHLPDAQRMFVVTLLLNEVVAWMRAQSGTTSLRAILYMDEVFGYLPPTANPPSKTPLLTLLKQARAFGVGCVLATQNPVDLDYKALSNAGTWFLGRLQTERDKLRVLDGLEGASATAGGPFDRAALERTLSGLEGRTFLMNDVHEDAPVLFRTRHALCYLRGPLTRTQIATLMAGRKATSTPDARAVASAAAARVAPSGAGGDRPVLPPGVVERFLPLRRALGRDETLLYRPALLGQGRVHVLSARDRVDSWADVTAIAPLATDLDADPWDDAGSSVVERAPQLDAAPDVRGRFDGLPAECGKKGAWAAWEKRLLDHLYRTQAARVFTCAAPALTSEPGETERDFRVRCAQSAREARDRAVGSLRAKWAPRLARVQDELRRAEERVERERAQARHQTTQTAISIGATLLGALFGRRGFGGATTAARGASRVGREREDVVRAEATVEDARRKLGELEQEFRGEVDVLQRSFEAERLAIESKEIAPRRADLAVHTVALLWTPWAVRPDGRLESLADAGQG